MSLSAPIGVFDSGMGGFAVAAQIRRLLPSEPILYLGDTAHLPFGPRPADEVAGFLRDAESFFVSEGAKAMVIACNTASVVADRLRGLIPAVEMVQPAVAEALAFRPRRIGVLGTAGTIRSRAYERRIAALSPTTTVVARACEDALRLAEQGGGNDRDLLLRLLTECMGPLLEVKCNVAIVACTDFTCVLPEMESINGGRMRLIDPAEAATVALRRTLAERDLLSEGTAPAHRFCVTGASVGRFAEFGRTAFGLPIARVETIRIAEVAA